MSHYRKINLAYAVIFGIIMLAAWVAHSQTAHPVAKPDAPKIAADAASKVPVVSDAQKLKFFKAQAELEGAQAAAKEATSSVQQKMVTLQSVVSEIANTCGKNFMPTMNKQGDPECVAKPAAPKDAENPAEVKK